MAVQIATRSERNRNGSQYHAQHGGEPEKTLGTFKR